MKKGSHSKHHSVGMGGGSLGFAGSIASFCMALLNAYCEKKTKTKSVLWVYSRQEENETKTSVNYLRLNLPEFSLFSAVHLTVDDQNVWQTSNVACLQLQWHKKNKKQHALTLESHVKNVLCVNMSCWYVWKGACTHCGLILLTVFTPRLSALLQTDALLQDLSKVILLYCLFCKMKWMYCQLIQNFCPPQVVLYASLAELELQEYHKLTLSVLFRVMHGEEQRERGADCLLATATQTAVLDFTSKQFSDGRLAGGTQRTESSWQQKQICDYVVLNLVYSNPLCLGRLQTQCWARRKDFV